MNTSWTRPDYRGGSIVNLMSSLMAVYGAASRYPPLRALDGVALGGRLVLIVIDGLGYRHLLRAPAGALRLHLRGAITSVFPTTTATSITTFMTGEAPQQHGLTAWHAYFSEVDRIVAVLPFRARGERVSLATHGTTVAHLYGHVPVFDRLDARSYVVAPASIAHSEFNRAHTGRATLRPYTDLADLFRDINEVLAKAGGRAYVYAYYGEIDRLGHEHGIGSERVARQLAVLDTAFGDFLRQLKGSDTTVIVTADHGFIDTTPERWITLATGDAVSRTLARPLAGEARVAYCYLRPGCDAAFRDAIAERLGDAADVVDSGRLIGEGYFGFGDAHPQLRQRIGDYTLLMRENYAIKDWISGERQYSQIGVHGGLSEAESLVPLIVASP